MATVTPPLWHVMERSTDQEQRVAMIVGLHALRLRIGKDGITLGFIEASGISGERGSRRSTHSGASSVDMATSKRLPGVPGGFGCQSGSGLPWRVRAGV